MMTTPTHAGTASAGERNRSPTRNSAGKEPVKQKSRPKWVSFLSVDLSVGFLGR